MDNVEHTLACTFLYTQTKLHQSS